MIMGEKKIAAANKVDKEKKKAAQLSISVKVVVLMLMLFMVSLWIYLTYTMRRNNDMFFYNKVTRHVSEYYSMRSDEYRAERSKYLKDNNISIIVAYTSARRILVSTTENMPFSELEAVNGNEIIPQQDIWDRTENPEFIVKSIIDVSKDLDGGYYYARLVDKEYADEMFRNKLRRDTGVVLLVFLAFLIMQIYNKFAAMRDDLKQKNDLVSLGSATRRLAHEIKNPVAAILMQVSLLERMHPDQAEEYEVIKTEGKRIANLTDRIREFMADPIGNIELINFIDFMREEVSYFKPGIITPNYYISDEASFIHFDRTRLRSIIINVIQNAIDSQAEKETCKVVINVSSVQNNSKIKVEIMDWGTGIKDSDKVRLFNPFFTTKNVGTGIGLSISKQFLNARNGSIDLSNRLDENGKVEGVTCTIILDKEKISG